MSNHLAAALGIGEAGRAERPFARLEDGRWYRHGDVDAVSARFALALRGLGVAPGDRVAAQVEKSIEAVMLYLGCVRAGAVFLPLNTAYTTAEIDYFVGNAEPALLVCDPARQEALAPVAEVHGARIETLGVWAADDGEHGSFFAHVPESPEGHADTPRGPDDLAAILYTSGTTGRSKGAMISHDNLASNARTLVSAWGFTEADRLIHALPIFHTHGLFVAINTVLASGASLIFERRFDPKAVLADMAAQDFPATAMMGVPTFYTRLLKEPELTAEVCRGMRLFTSGSAPLLAETHRAWEVTTGHRILERYGMTETNMNTSNPLDGARKAGTVGPPLPGVEVIVADTDGRRLPRGETGMVEVRGPNVFKGYWRMPEKTAEELRESGFLITGDLGRFDEDGYLTIVGRQKDLVISGGYNVYPKEVETALDAVAGVSESAVIGVPHPDFGEAVVAVVVPADAGVEGSDEAGLIAAVAGGLARYKQPKRVIFVDALPRNTMGKVQKKALREAYADLFAPT